MTTLQTSRDRRNIRSSSILACAGRESGRFLAVSVTALSLFSSVACSSSSDEPADEGTGGKGGGSSSTGGSSSSGSGGQTATGGSSSTGGGATANGGSSGAGGGGNSDALIGSFLVTLTPANDSLGTPASTQVVGKVSDGPSPEAIVWEASQTSGSCRLMKPRVPFCDPSCGSDVCVADDVCHPYPTAKSVGTVTVTGIENGSGTEFSMDAIAGNYQPVGVAIQYPGFDASSTIKVTTSGGDFAPLVMEAKGIAPLVLAAGTLALESSKPLSISWDAATAGATSKVHVKLDISHHGGTKGMIECDAEDSGSVVIAAELVTKLLALGVAGFPTIVVTRGTSGSAQTPSGKVALDVTSPVERAVTVPGLVSCSGDEDCPGGKKCQSDLSCK
jgi:hypothetical protein